MHRARLWARLLASLAAALCLAGPAAAASHDGPPPGDRFVAVDGVRLQYVDWGGRGPVLILIPGLGDSPHIFDDLAPAFTGRLHVIAYAPRGHGSSDPKPPFDTETLTRDLIGFMDRLGIRRASLAGHSMAGNVLTVMAADHPGRVSKIVYLDAGYDWSDPAFRETLTSFPDGVLSEGGDHLASLDAYRAHLKQVQFPGLDEMGRVEAYVRDKVVVQPDGRVRERVSDETTQALRHSLWRNRRLDYGRVHVPALALYASTTMDLRSFGGDRQAVQAWERDHMAPFRERSARRLRNELAGVRIVRVPGAHSSFFLTSRRQVVCAMRGFLEGASRGCPTDKEEVAIEIATSRGAMRAVLFPGRAPVTTCNFLRYVAEGDFTGGRFVRAVMNDGDRPGGIDVIQAQARDPAAGNRFGPIPLERTGETGLRHGPGTLSMARGGPDTATSGFFIVVRGGADLDQGGARAPDGQGFGAFGRITRGLDVAAAIQHGRVEGERLTPPIGIIGVKVLAKPPGVCGA